MRRRVKANWPSSGRYIWGSPLNAMVRRRSMSAVVAGSPPATLATRRPAFGSGDTCREVRVSAVLNTALLGLNLLWESGVRHPRLHQSAEPLAPNIGVREQIPQLAARHEADFLNERPGLLRIATRPAPPAAPPPQHPYSLTLGHPLPPDHVEVRLHREPVVGSLDPIRGRQPHDFPRHRPLLLDGEKMLDHRVA